MGNDSIDGAGGQVDIIDGLRLNQKYYYYQNETTLYIWSSNNEIIGK